MWLALPVQVWPAIAMFTAASTVRSVKLALSVAELSVPTAPVPLVGEVEPITLYDAVPVRGSATGPLCAPAKMYWRLVLRRSRPTLWPPLVTTACPPDQRPHVR